MSSVHCTFRLAGVWKSSVVLSTREAHYRPIRSAFPCSVSRILSVSCQNVYVLVVVVLVERRPCVCDDPFGVR